MNDQAPIAELSGLGPFFAVDHHARNAAPAGPWQPLTRLIRPDGVRSRIEQVRAALATTGGRTVDDVPWRVAASVAHLGLVARLISPPLGARILGLDDLQLEPESTWWQPIVGGPVPLSVRADALARISGDVEGVFRQALALTELFAAESVSLRVLWGNVASAVNGAYHAIGSTRPELAPAAQVQTLAALRYPLLLGMSNEQPGSGFRRTNCCLIYQLGPAVSARQVCGDCALRTTA